jgi:hypothetical protein
VEPPEQQRVYPLDLSHTFDPFGSLPGVEAEPASAAPLSSHPMAAPAAPFAPAGPQVWRTGAHRKAEPGTDISHALPAAAAGVPEALSEPAHAAVDDEQPSYAPTGRVEPRLESVAQAEAEPAPAAEPAEAAMPAPEAPAPSFVPRDRIEPSFDLPVDEEIVAQALPSFEDEAMLAEAPSEPEPQPQAEPEPEPEPATPVPPAPVDAIAAAALPLRASTGIEPAPPGAAALKSPRSRAADARARRSSLKPGKVEPPPQLRLPQEEADEPEFVKRSRRLERSGRTRNILLGSGAAVLALVLLAQLVLGFGNSLAARHPGLKPVLTAACAVLGCRIDLPSQVANLSIETGELATLAPDTYSLNTLLRNQGTLVQAWPSIELELTDDANKPVLRRVFGPQDYLPPGTSAAAGFGPRSEQPIRLHFSLADVKPSDYHLFVFYP